MNPYSGAGFFEFFGILLHRIALFLTGSPLHIAQDEVQLATLGCCAIGCGVIGPFLVLKRMTMFANSLSHTTLLGVVGAFLFASFFWGSGLNDIPTLLIGALFSAILTAAFTEGIVRLFRLQEDASIGLVFTSLFALGVVFVTLFTRSVHVSAEAVMGNPDALQLSDLKLASFLALANIAAIALFYRKLLLSAFDPSFSKTVGSQTGLLRAILFLLTSATAIGAFRAVGVLVVLALLVGPYITARLFCHRLKHLLFWTPAVGLLCSVIGVALSRAILTYTGLPLSTAGLIAATIGFAFGAACMIKTKRQITFKKESVH